MKVVRIGVAGALMASVVLQGCTTTSGGAGVYKTATDRAITQCVGSVMVGAVGGALIGAAFNGDRGAGQGALVGAALGLGHCAVLMELAAAEDREALRQAEMAAIVSNNSQTKTITTKSGKTATVRTKVTSAPLPKSKAVAAKKPAANAIAATKVAPVDSSAVQAAVTADPLANSPMANGAVTSAAPNDSVTPQSAAQPAKEVQTADLASQASYKACRYSEMTIDLDGSSASGGKQMWCQSSTGDWQPVAG